MESKNSDSGVLKSIFILFVVLILLVLLPYFEEFYNSMNITSRTVTPRGELSSLEKSTIELFQKSSPSVVYITTLEDYINLFTKDITRIPKGTGSGFIWDEQGHIITNYHVIKGASIVRVRLHDKRVFNAKVIGASPNYDIAVLKMPISSRMPKPIPIGESHNLKVGQSMYAIGNPFGFDYTLTTGIVSALNRVIQTDDRTIIEGLIQTDTAINPGNSGGPLLDSFGRVIGVNTAIYSPSGAYSGIGFAVPIDSVNKIVPKIISKR